MYCVPIAPRYLLIAATLAASCLVPDPARADWPSFRGPSGLGVSGEKGLSSRFPLDGPKVLWEAKVGTGTSVVTVAGGRAFTIGNVGKSDQVICFEAATGKQVWKHEFPLDVDKRMFEGGPAASPTLDSGRVYTVSHQGDLWCLDAATGKKVWYHHYQRDFGGRRPHWGYAGSATVEGQLLILDVGAKDGSTVALDKTTGQTVWKSGEDEAGYATPIVATIAGQRTAVVFKAEALIGLDVKDGRELWRYPWKTSYEVNAATPLVVGDRIFVSSGYGSGCAVIEIGKSGATEKWRNKNLRAHIASPVFSKGAIFGIDDQASARSPLVCLDMNSGQVKWTQRGVGGALIGADGKLFILAESGELIVAEDTASAFKSLARAQVLPRRCWVQPTLSDGRLYCRNNDGKIVCLDLTAK